MRLAVLANPAAGGGRSSGQRRVEDWVSECRRRGHEVVVLEAASATDVPDAIDRAFRLEGVERVLLAGGDGLVHAALPALVGQDRAVGVLPNGTGNDIARAFGLGRRRALDTALGPVRAADVLEVVDGHGRREWAASVVTTGFSGQVNERADAIRRPRGSMKYTLATLAELGRLEAVDADIAFDGEDEQRKVSLVAVGNTPFFGGGMKICPGASATDGLLDVVVVDEVSPLVLAAVLPAAFVGLHIRHPAVSLRRCRTVSIELHGARGDDSAWADGERLHIAAPTVRAVPGGLRLAFG